MKKVTELKNKDTYCCNGVSSLELNMRIIRSFDNSSVISWRGGKLGPFGPLLGSKGVLSNCVDIFFFIKKKTPFSFSTTKGLEDVLPSLALSP